MVPLIVADAVINGEMLLNDFITALMVVLLVALLWRVWPRP